MKIIKAKNIFKAHFLIMFALLLTLSGCGNGGSGSGGNVSSGNVSNDSGVSEVNGPSLVDNSITLAWDKPDSNSDGTDLNDLAGYKIYYGPSSNNYTQSINVGNISSAVISNLSSGTWCFATTAYDTAGNESGYSNEACKTI
ncbi:MAG: fibronectin type III domain-containing protein [Nitrospirae bacterium]|nr:fibronectin type III domain-containing protein [Nitrospirota bacterium]